MIEYYQGSIDIRGYDGYTRVTVKLPIPKEYNLLKKGLEPKYRGLKLVKKKGEEKT